MLDRCDMCGVVSGQRAVCWQQWTAAVDSGSGQEEVGILVPDTAP